MGWLAWLLEVHLFLFWVFFLTHTLAVGLSQIFKQQPTTCPRSPPHTHFSFLPCLFTSPPEAFMSPSHMYHSCTCRLPVRFLNSGSLLHLICDERKTTLNTDSNSMGSSTLLKLAQ